jgi:hypothetical protein
MIRPFRGLLKPQFGRMSAAGDLDQFGNQPMPLIRGSSHSRNRLLAGEAGQRTL